MRLFAISDLHLPFGANKPMDIFGGWDNYTERLYENWQKIVAPEDTVVIPGDISWTLSLNDAIPDFEYIH
ncbi:MAG TPA: serine/threonine protein phosphatase, partial [Ruminococcaceae bacterium]|nr:serine/threonine protein phosphatase [Oscillospiraceae bacterium]